MSTRRRKSGKNEKMEGSDCEKTARMTVASDKEKQESSGNNSSMNQKTKEGLQVLKEKQAKSEGNEKMEESSGNQSAMKKSSSGSGRLRDLSQRVQKSFQRTFVSRPVQQAQFQKFVTKVEKREETRSKTKQKRQLRRGDDSFHRVGSVKGFSKKHIDGKDDDMVNEHKKGKRSKRDPKKMSFLDNGDPFWLEEKEVKHTIQDHLPLNADVVIKVLEGKVDLEEMPRVPVVLDQFNEKEDMTKRDKLFFNKPLLFGNTLRSIINISEESFRARHKKKPMDSPKEMNQVPFEEPKYMKFYDRKGVVASIREGERKPPKFGNTRDTATSKLREPQLLPGADDELVESYPGRKKKDKGSSEKKDKGSKEKKDNSQRSSLRSITKSFFSRGSDSKKYDDNKEAKDGNSVSKQEMSKPDEEPENSN